jgi:hypothetical protein
LYVVVSAVGAEAEFSEPNEAASVGAPLLSLSAKMNL